MNLEPNHITTIASKLLSDYQKWVKKFLRIILLLGNCMKTKCYSVRLQSLVSISDKAYKATAFDGSTAIIPKSQVFGMDYSVQKSGAYWISSWILGQKDIQYSSKKEAWFDSDTGDMLPTYNVEHHFPTKKEKVNINIIKELQK